MRIVSRLGPFIRRQNLLLYSSETFQSNGPFLREERVRDSFSVELVTFLLNRPRITTLPPFPRNDSQWNRY